MTAFVPRHYAHNGAEGAVPERQDEVPALEPQAGAASDQQSDGDGADLTCTIRRDVITCVDCG